MEFLVCCVFAYWFVKHIPEIAGDTAEAIAAAWNGQESPRLKARRERLDEAGVDPAHGGAFGQWWSNTWSDFWLDQDRKRRGRAASGRQGRGLLGWVRDAWNARVDERADRWRKRSAEEGPAPPTEPAVDDPQAEPQPAADPADRDRTDPPPPPGVQDHEPTMPDPTPPREPVRVPSHLGDPTPAAEPEDPTPTATADPELEPERTNPMTQALAPNGTAVTGVLSGAAEARAIERYLAGATEAYDAAMANARKRIHALGEQTVGVVQMAAKSDVVDATAQAAESIAAAQAGANLCKAETIPLLGRVARGFERLNS